MEQKYFQEYHFDATEVTYLKHQITGSTLKLASSPTGDFSNGELFTGGTSGVRATVHAYHSANTTLRYKDPKVKSGGDGNTYYANTTTTFSTGETLTGSTSGATATTHASTATAFGDYDKKYVQPPMPQSKQHKDINTLSIKIDTLSNKISKLEKEIELNITKLNKI